MVETDAVTFYHTQSQHHAAAPAAYAALRAKGAAALKAHGFPTRRIEAWKYTPTPPLLAHRFEPMTTPALQIDLPEAPGARLLSLEAAWREMPERMAQHFTQYPLPLTHGFHAMNAALLMEGWVMVVPDYLQITAPIRVSFPAKDPLQASYTHLWVLLGKQTRCTLLEDASASASHPYLTNHLTEICLEAGATCTHIALQREGRAAYHLSHVFAYQANDSHFNSHVVNLGGAWVRSDKSIYLQGPQATCTLNGLYALNDQQHMDHHTAIFHEVGACHSQQDYKGVIAGQAKAVFNGRVVVAEQAQHTQAQQHNKNLLLSAGASVNTEPQLEIYADDVRCSHGATVGALNPDALFYLASRGLPLKDATQLLVAGFTAPNLAQLGQPTLETQLAHQLQQHLVRES